jgi:glucan phosphoethanolaminetransferase (alkaline phosphatase superfamily)
MFQYNLQKGNKTLAIIFTAIFCVVGILIIISGIKLFVTGILILLFIVGYIAFMKFRLFGTTLTGENLHKRGPIDLTNLNINATESGAKEFDE